MAGVAAGVTGVAAAVGRAAAAVAAMAEQVMAAAAAAVAHMAAAAVMGDMAAAAMMGDMAATAMAAAAMSVALEQTEESCHGLIDPHDYRFMVLQFTGPKISAHFLFKFSPTVQPVANDHPFHRQSFGGDVK